MMNHQCSGLSVCGAMQMAQCLAVSFSVRFRV